MKHGFKKVLVIGDNAKMMIEIAKIIFRHAVNDLADFKFASSPGSNFDIGTTKSIIDVNDDFDFLTFNFDLILSVHCRQIFPCKLVQTVKCINLHPGYNPFNRGCYSHVFSILNKFPTGATIHEIDEKIDHGNIIAQELVQVNSWDTSGTLYERICKTEIELFKENITNIIRNQYDTFQYTDVGNFNQRKDYEMLKFIDPEQTYSGRNLIDRLRALTHEGFDNAYFFDDHGEKIFIQIQLRRAGDR